MAYSTQEIHANIWGTLKPHVPNLNQLNADYAYKVTYLGKYKSKNLTVDTLINKEVLSIDSLDRNSSELFVVFPNPNNGQFMVRNNEIFHSVKIYNDKGEIVFEITNLNCLEFDVDLVLASGTYLIQVQGNNNSYSNKKFIVL